MNRSRLDEVEAMKMATPRWPVAATRPEPGLDIIEIPVTPRYSLMKALFAPTIQEPPTVRRFADSKLQDSIDKVLAGLPGESKAVEVNIAGNAQGVTGVVVVKLDGGWSIAGGVNYVPGGEWTGQVSARKVWR